jgi:hypothetical protein
MVTTSTVSDVPVKLQFGWLHRPTRYVPVVPRNLRKTKLSRAMQVWLRYRVGKIASHGETHP